MNTESITKKITRILIVIFGVAVICAFIICVYYRRHAQPIYPIFRQIEYSFSLQNQTNQLVRNAEFWTYAPVKKTATQHCGRLESSYPFQKITDGLGNQILHFTFDIIPPYATKIVTIKAELGLSEEPNRMSADDFQPHLRSATYIESDNSEMIRVAKKLEGPSPKETVERIYKYVASNVKYSGYLKNARGALYALQEKKGDCTEYMYLFAALCRANNIPTQCVGGYICSKSSILKPAEYHNWAEFYMDGSWRLADPQNSVFMENHSNYIAMRIIKDQPDDAIWQFDRFRFKGPGLKVKMN